MTCPRLNTESGSTRPQMSQFPVTLTNRPHPLLKLAIDVRVMTLNYLLLLLAAPCLILPSSAHCCAKPIPFFTQTFSSLINYCLIHVECPCCLLLLWLQPAVQVGDNNCALMHCYPYDVMCSLCWLSQPEETVLSNPVGVMPQISLVSFVLQSLKPQRNSREKWDRLAIYAPS